jgi:hypothetical protein
MTFHRAAIWLKDHHVPVRLILSVVAGIAISMVLSVATHEVLHLCGIYPPLTKPMFDTGLVVIELIYHSVYAVVAAIFTAKLAKEMANKAVFVLGTKEAIMWVLGTLLLWKHSPPWYNLSKALLGIPLALLGGYLYKKFFRKSVGDHHS